MPKEKKHEQTSNQSSKVITYPLDDEQGLQSTAHDHIQEETTNVENKSINCLEAHAIKVIAISLASLVVGATLGGLGVISLVTTTAIISTTLALVFTPIGGVIALAAIVMLALGVSKLLKRERAAVAIQDQNLEQAYERLDQTMENHTHLLNEVLAQDKTYNKRMKECQALIERLDKRTGEDSQEKTGENNQPIRLLDKAKLTRNKAEIEYQKLKIEMESLHDERENIRQQTQKSYQQFTQTKGEISVENIQSTENSVSTGTEKIREAQIRLCEAQEIFYRFLTQYEEKATSDLVLVV